ncbi:MAG: glycosyltransferase family 2 protein [Gemmatimonadota bacterium]|nr:MAG: glycosyltransferase family 2 protein [Gemmatimonadota bacterium]
MEAPRVTIGLPVYNGERFLGETIESILCQTFTDFLLVLSDNCSTDRTCEICQAYADKDERVKYVRQATNVGAAENYNWAFKEARSEFFKWAAADDLLGPDFLRRCIEVLDGDPSLVIAYAKARFIDTDGKPLEVRDLGWHLVSEWPAERLAYVLSHGHWCNVVFGVIRREALARTSLIADYPGQDYRLLGELALIGKFYEVPAPLFLRRLHQGASSQNTELDWQLEFFTPQKEDRICLPRWSRSIDHARTIAGADLPLRDKLRLERILLREMRWKRDKLAGEVRSALRQIVLGNTRHGRSSKSHSH